MPDLQTLIVMAAFAVAIIVGTVPRINALRRRLPRRVDGAAPEPPFCGRCGYSLHGLDLPNTACPECGTPPGPKREVWNRRKWLLGAGYRLGWHAVSAIVLSAWAAHLLLPGFYARFVDYQLSRPRSHMAAMETEKELERSHYEVVFLASWQRWGTCVCSFDKLKSLSMVLRVLGATVQIDREDAGYRIGGTRVQRTFTADDLLEVMTDAGLDTADPLLREEARFVIEAFESVGAKKGLPQQGSLFDPAFTHVPVGTGDVVHRPPWITIPFALIAWLFWLRSVRHIPDGPDARATPMP